MWWLLQYDDSLRVNYTECIVCSTGFVTQFQTQLSPVGASSSLQLNHGEKHSKPLPGCNTACNNSLQHNPCCAACETAASHFPSPCRLCCMAARRVVVVLLPPFSRWYVNHRRHATTECASAPRGQGNSVASTAGKIVGHQPSSVKNGEKLSSLAICVLIDNNAAHTRALGMRPQSPVVEQMHAGSCEPKPYLE